MAPEVFAQKGEKQKGKDYDSDGTLPSKTKRKQTSGNGEKMCESAHFYSAAPSGQPAEVDVRLAEPSQEATANDERRTP